MATKEKEVKMLGTKEVAAKLKVTPGRLRRVLRANGKNKAGEYTRYQWDPKDELKGLRTMLEAAEKEEAAEKKAKPAKKADKKAAPKKAAKKKAAKKEDADEEGFEEVGEETEELG